MADRLAAKLAGGPGGPIAPPPRLVDAAEVARRFGLRREWVYEHADRLGAVRLGDGPRPRLRFKVERVEQALAARASREPNRSSPSPDAPAPTDLAARRRRRPRPSSAHLLPIRGRER
ncbi:MAG: hypothetical protein M3P48_01320 [Actinomycetota bacterium]|nr:hypothetical protein [Actinomycetota bacterium]